MEVKTGFVGEGHIIIILIGVFISIFPNQLKAPQG